MPSEQVVRSLVEVLSRTQRAQEYLDEREKETIAKWGEVTGRIILLAAEVGFIVNDSICPQHGTDECTCDPRAALEKAINGLRSVAVGASTLVATAIPAVTGRKMDEAYAGELADAIFALQKNLEFAQNIANGVEDSEGGKSPQVEASSVVMPPSNVVQ